MMIVELIDGDDFRARLTALGIEIPQDADPETSAQLAAQAHQAHTIAGLPTLAREFMAQKDVLLPSVRHAIEAFLPVE